jgi:HEAT repeat protein
MRFDILLQWPGRWIGMVPVLAVLTGFSVASAEEKSIAALIQQLRSPRFEERESAMKELIRVGAPALPALRGAVQSTDPELVRRATDCVAIIERNVQIAAHIQALKDEDWRKRANAAEKLVDFGPWGEPAIPALLDAMEDENPFVWTNAMRAIGKVGPKATRAIPRLIHLLKAPEDEKNRSSEAARTLGEIGSAAADSAPALLELLKKGGHPVQRREAATALGLIGGDNNNLVPALTRALNDSEVEVRCRAASALAQIRKEPAVCVPALVELLKKERALQGDAVSRYDDPMQIVIRALGQFGPDAKAAVPTLIEILKDPKQLNGGHQMAIECLGKIGPDAKEAVPILKQFNTYPIHAERTAKALKAIQSPPTNP